MPKTKTAPTAAATYARLSLDKNGDGLGVARQRELCRKLATERGWPLIAEYVDNSISATNGKARPEYRRLLADIEAGTVDAVVVVDIDRLTRRPAELEQFMELADRHGVALANVSGDTDLSSSDGRLKARILGAVARQESEKKAERQRRESEQAARRGVPRGSRRPFGYEPDRVTLREPEADLIREAARRMIAGETAASIAHDWNARSVAPPQGARHGWGAGTIARILRSPRTAGLRSYRGEIVGDGAWEPILDRTTWETLNARIARVARVGRPAKHLLSGIARCGGCGGVLWASWVSRNGRQIPRYVCTKRPGTAGCGKVAVAGVPLDELVRDAVIAALAGPALRKARKARKGNDQDQTQAARELADAEERLQVLADEFAASNISRREWMAGRDRAQERIRAAQKVLDADAGPLADLPGDETALRAAWDAGNIDWRRALIQTVIDKAVVKPAPRPAPRFDPDRVEIRWAV